MQQQQLVLPRLPDFRDRGFGDGDVLGGRQAFGADRAGGVVVGPFGCSRDE